jgi:hypothetical protein
MIVLSDIGELTRRLASIGAVVAVTSCLAIGAAQAVTFSIVGGDTVNYEIGNGFAPFDPNGGPIGDLPNGTSITVFDSVNTAGANAGKVGLFMDPGNVVLKFTYMGSEAGFSNSSAASFSFAGNELFSNKTAAVGDSKLKVFGEGAGNSLMPFLFKSITNSGAEAVNGGPISSSVKMAFVVLGLDIAYALFEDTGSGGDNDFDDMVIRIQAGPPGAGNEVPLPPAIILFGSALVGLTWLSRRRRGKAPVAV